MIRNWLSLVLPLALFACGDPEPPAAVDGPPVPPEGFIGDAAQGAVLYAAHCAQCHGVDLSGSHQGPPLLHPVYEPGHHSDYSFYLAVRNGVRAHHWPFGDMPPVAGVDAAMAGHIVAYVRREQLKAGIR